MNRSQRNRVQWAVIVVLFVVLIPVLYLIAIRVTVPMKGSRDQASLRSVASALESYLVDWSEYPHELDLLTQVPDVMAEGEKIVEIGPFLFEIPRSAFGKHPYPQYYRGSYHWFLWMPGSDGDYDLAFNDDFMTAFDLYWKNEDWRGPTISSPWLNERLYDPSNGIRSSGDMLRTQFQ